MSSRHSVGPVLCVIMLWASLKLSRVQIHLPRACVPRTVSPDPHRQLLPWEVCEGVGLRVFVGQGWALSLGSAVCPCALVCGANAQRDSPRRPLLLPCHCIL